MGIDSLLSQPSGVVLPPFENEAFVSQRHEVNPAIALNLLNDIHSAIVSWQEQLRHLVQATEALIAQGPMVDGWLESSVALCDGLDQFATGAEAALLRHGDADALMQYVEALERGGSMPADAAIGELEATLEAGSPSGSLAQYRLYCLGEDGVVRSHHCPPEQMASVSTAIARYQTYKQLVVQKAAIEAKLQQVVDALTGTRARLQADPQS